MPSSTAASVTRAGAPGAAPWMRSCTSTREFGRARSGALTCTSRRRAAGSTWNQTRPSARRGAPFASSPGRNTVTATCAPAPQAASTSRTISAPPSGTSISRSDTRRSVSTATLARPAKGGATRSRAVSPGAKARRSAATSTRSGTSAVSPPAQPARKRIEAKAFTLPGPPTSSASSR